MMDTFKRILIATDGSDSSEHAVRTGLEFAKIVGADVTALSVMEDPVLLSTPADSHMKNLYALLEQEGKETVKRVKDIGSSMGVNVSVKVVSGNPARVIVDEGAKCDLIVIGTLGRSGITKLLIGSVAEKVVKLAKCPVLVVRDKGGSQ